MTGSDGSHQARRGLAGLSARAVGERGAAGRSARRLATASPGGERKTLPIQNLRADGLTRSAPPDQSGTVAATQAKPSQPNGGKGDAT